ncbi:hypothetical protein AADEFJLK_00793 [Methylovulum psychrotolerans]|uniref:CBM-cenC domain-containing protein n=2 Tax=Methylovulum psychrotolerans TaxID=1704499 RepID=A0A2S5CSN3_9GAMM|nr:hypothetical protein AADEFJLK_00793 [Methylovulum psychrotolerans]
MLESMGRTHFSRYGYAFCCVVFCCPVLAASPERHYQVEPQAISAQVPRLGVNLGEWVAWGAGQLSANVLKNPGFEGIIDRAIVLVKAADGVSFSDDTAWTKRPDGFWAGARYDVRSGGAVGQQGLLFDSKAVGKMGLPEFTVIGNAPPLSPGDVVSLTLTNDRRLPSQWWFDNGLLPGQLTVVSDDVHPDSPGLRSLALSPLAGKPVEVLSYLDSIGDRAGKLLPVNGKWKLRLWLKQKSPGAKLTVSFRRLNGGPAFFQETLSASGQWQQLKREFTAQDVGAAGTLSLSLRVEGTEGQIIVDDIELGAVVNAAEGAFRPEVVAALKRLQPGYLRDWQGQLGDTFANRIADSFARRASRYRPGAESTFSYGLPEFLQLAATVGAQPWVVVPPTLGDEELQQFGRYLASQADVWHFKEVLVEFGNENWNSVFRPAGIPAYQAHGEAATRAFRYLLEGANHHSALHTVVNGQYVNPWLSAKYLGGVSNAQTLAVAPYFLFKLNADDDLLSKLFSQDDFYRETRDATRMQGKELSVYEVNLHTTSGTASVASRNTATTSAAAGAALAQRLLTGLNAGISRQCLYTLAQYDAFVEGQQNPRELVKLWGIVRDLGASPRLRPTGLAMEMLNRVLPAAVYPLRPLEPEDKALTLTALQTPKGWALAAVSAKPDVQTIKVRFPDGADKQHWRLLTLASAAPTDNNEDAEQVRILETPLAAQGGELGFAIPAYGFVVVSAGE